MWAGADDRLKSARRQTRMASMWRRAMVYLGLQDDDELDYSGEYESYGEYGDVSDAPQNPRSGRGPNDVADGRDHAVRESGTVRTAREAVPDYGDYAASERGAHHRSHQRGPGPRGRTAGLQRRAGGGGPPQGEPAGHPEPPGPAP